VRTSPIATPAEDLDVAGVVAEDGRRVLVLSPASTAAGIRLERDLRVADALTGTPLRPVVPPVLGYVKLPEGGRCAVTEAPVGRPLMLEDLQGSEELARSLGQVLARVHTVPRYAAEAAGVESFTPEVLHARHRARVDAVHAAGHLPAAVAQRWDALLADQELWDFTPQFLHGDLSEESLFVSGRRLSAVRDWSSSLVGDPAADLAWLISSLDPERFDDLYSAYREELPTSSHPRLMERAQALGEFAVAEWLEHGLEVEDEEIIADAKGMIADLDADLAQIARDEAERAYEAMNAREDASAVEEARPSEDAQPSEDARTDRA
jgi:aminoglycoside phosphotransferase (APT) family kinase protein